MTEEEKEAIDALEDLAEYGLCYTVTEDIQDKLKTILNLIIKQQEEIEHLKNLNNHQSKEIQKAVDYTFELNKEIEKKDKIIDEMGKCLNKLINNIDIEKGLKECEDNVDCIKQYFERKAEV